MNLKVLDGSLTFRDSFREMLESVKVPFEECKQTLRDSEYILNPPRIALRSATYLESPELRDISTPCRVPAIRSC